MAGDYIARLYDRLEFEVIRDIARRVQKTNRYTETAEIQAKALRDQGYSPARIQAEVMKQLGANNDYMQFVAVNTREYKQMVKQIIKDTVEEAKATGDAFVANAGTMAWNDDLQIWKEHGVDLKKDNALQQMQDAIKDQTEDELQNITRTSALNIGGVPILDAFHHELDLAVLKTASGSFSFQQAMEDCCRRLGKGGVQVVYPSGRKYSMEAAARMCMKTGLSQLAGKVTEHNMQKTGTSLVYVSAHAGSRPEHAVWQGKVYTYSGKPTEEYPDFVDSTDYGTVTGLKGVNCSHEFYPHWPGDPIPEFKEPEPKIINGEEYTFYEATQEQRRMEREVLNLSREKAAAEATGNTAKAQELEKRIRQVKNDYGSFSRQAGLRPKTERMKIYDSSKNTKAVINANIEKRNPGRGKAASIELFGEKLSKRQEYLNSIIKESGVFYEFNKRDISLKDLAALTSNNGVEYAIFTKGNKRIAMRGYKTSVPIGETKAEKLAKEGYKWSGHTHPGITPDTLSNSDGDSLILAVFKKYKRQQASAIYNSAGKMVVFYE